MMEYIYNFLCEPIKYSTAPLFFFALSIAIQIVKQFGSFRVNSNKNYLDASDWPYQFFLVLQKYS